MCISQNTIIRFSYFCLSGCWFTTTRICLHQIYIFAFSLMSFLRPGAQYSKGSLLLTIVYGVPRKGPKPSLSQVDDFEPREIPHTRLLGKTSEVLYKV